MAKEPMSMKLQKLIAELEQTEKQLMELRKKLVEAQERNRRLDWLLTEATERLESLSR